ncbi:hypothetical protein L6303_01950 [archaeon]|nr:hypothetical protein [Nanoarchaeota archaeon]MBU4451789.1 hypothetical protein [Nanoarchaeota archaeon]MCG2723482.1 hypothetical protein [archaeon]
MALTETEKKIVMETRDELQRLAKKIQSLLDEKSSVEVPDWMRDRVELWGRIYNRGGVVSDEQFRELWCTKMGKDIRGAGGFYVGKNPSLIKLTDGKTALTQSADKFCQEMLGLPLSEMAKQFSEKKI